MILDMKCINEKCNKYDKVKMEVGTHAELQERKCSECGELLTRVWSTGSAGIRTSDGYKG